MTDSDDRPRPRRRKTARKKSGPSVLLVCAILGMVIVVAAAGAAAVVLFVTKIQPVKPQAEAVGSPVPVERPVVPAGPVVPAAPNVPNVAAVVPPPKLPAGWAYNNPALGFRAAWPVAPAADGYAPVNLLGNVGVGGGKSYGNEASGIVYSVGWSDMSYIPGAAEIDPLALVDRYLARAKELAAARGAPVESVQPLPATTSGVPGREIRNKGGVQRYVAVHGKVWMLFVMSETKDVNPTDPKVTTFFDTFAALK